MTLKCPKCYSENMRRHSYTEAGNQRFSCKECGFRTVSPIGLNHINEDIDQSVVSSNLRLLKGKKKWLITSAQNATPPHQGLLNNIRAYANDINAQIIVTPNRYRNPTSIFSDADHDWWHEDLVPYLLDKRVEICPGLVLLGDILIQPTAVNPLTGLEGFTGTQSCIVGHPKYQFKTVPTRQGDLAKLMSTTGSITVENYTPTKAGKKGHHHHTFGFCIVEWDGEYFHIRHVSANNDGSFTDLNRCYKGGVAHLAPAASALVLGDLHQWWIDPNVDEATFGRGGIIQTLDPEKVILHDSVDFYSASHHHRGDPFIKYAKHKYAKNNVHQEIVDFVNFIKERMDRYRQYYIVCSNHDDHLTRWVKESDWKDDPENAEFYLETALYMLRNTTMESWGNNTARPFDWWVRKYLSIDILGRDQSLEIHGVEHGLHGDSGPNGSRGSPQNLSKIGVKATVGHYHSPAVVEGLYAVGTSTGKMAYAKGPSGWLNSHVVLYADGKRSHIHIINGRWRG